MRKCLTIILAVAVLGCTNQSADQCNCVGASEEDSPLEGIAVHTDFESAVSCAQKCSKPIFLWFTGWAVISTRTMEEETFQDSRLNAKLRDQFVIACLYVDDKRELLLEEQKVVEVNGKQKELKNIGHKNTFFQISRFGSNAQPHFIVLSSDGEQILAEFFYNPDANEINQILDEALDRFGEEAVGS